VTSWMSPLNRSTPEPSSFEIHSTLGMASPRCHFRSLTSTGAPWRSVLALALYRDLPTSMYIHIDLNRTGPHSKILWQGHVIKIDEIGILYISLYLRLFLHFNMRLQHRIYNTGRFLKALTNFNDPIYSAVERAIHVFLDKMSRHAA
jgi:hypothetical protein